MDTVHFSLSGPLAGMIMCTANNLELRSQQMQSLRTDSPLAPSMVSGRSLQSPAYLLCMTTKLPGPLHLRLSTLWCQHPAKYGRKLFCFKHEHGPVLGPLPRSMQNLIYLASSIEFKEEQTALAHIKMLTMESLFQPKKEV